MAVGLGLNTWLAFGEESTYGTAVTRTKFLEITDESIAGKQQVISKPALRQVSQSNRVQGKKDVGGNFKFQFPFENAEKILKHAMGAIAAPTGIGPFVHALTLTAALPTGLSVEVNRDSAAIGGSTAFLYTGCQINKLTLTQEKEDFCMCDVDLIGQDWSQVALTSATFPTFNGMDWSMFTATIGGANINAESAELTIENGLAADRYKLGSRIRKGLGRGQSRKISGKFVIEYEQNTEYARYLTQTITTSITLNWSNGLGGASLKQFSLILPNCVIQGSDPKASDQGPIKLEIPFEAFQNAAAHDEMTGTLTNSTNTAQ